MTDNDCSQAATDAELVHRQQPLDQFDMQAPLTDTSDDQTNDYELDHSVTDAIDSNTQLLEQLLEQFSDLREIVLAGNAPAEQSEHQTDESEIQAECQYLRERVDELENEARELQQQNSDLAAQVASSSVRQTVKDSSSGCDDALSWEERKKLILQQMEEDTFDAETFHATLNVSDDGESQSPSEFVEHLSAELNSRDAELASREDEIRELQHLLEHQSETRDGKVAIGAAAIAEMIDSDELVHQERERLQLLQAEWEEKFREGEIAASLERAKLSRERQELAKKQYELEEQLAQLQRDARQQREPDSGASRKWMAKLGLAEEG